MQHGVSIPASAYWVLGLQMFTTTCGSRSDFSCMPEDAAKCQSACLACVMLSSTPVPQR